MWLLMFLKPIGKFFASIPWKVWAVIAVVAVLVGSFWLYGNAQFNAGVKQCEAKQAKAQQKALAESITQELNAPVIAQKAQADIEPIIVERVRVIRENIKYTACADVEYPSGVQASVREASAAVDRVR